MSSSSLFLQLTNVTVQLSRYVVPLIILIGNINNIANILIFSRRSLRNNNCSFYFICLSIAHLMLLDTHGIPRVMAVFMGSDVSRQINTYCKARSYCITVSMILARHFICVISIDRWLISSSNPFYRRQYSLTFVLWLIIISVAVWAAFSIHSLIGFSSYTWGCSPTPKSTYALFFSLYSVATSILPLIIMIWFTLFTIFNIRISTQRLVHPISHSISNSKLSGRDPPSTIAQRQFQEQRSKRDMQFVRLAIVQVASYTLLNSICTIYPILSFVTDQLGFYIVGGPLDVIVTFVSHIGMNLLYIYASSTFFLYTLASSTFRKEGLALLKEILAKLWRTN